MLTRTVGSVLLGSLVLLAAVRAKAAEDVKLPAYLDAKPAKPADGDDVLHKLLKERYNAALKAAGFRYRHYMAGTGNGQGQLFAACRTLLEAELELVGKPAEQVAVREKFLALAKEVETMQEALFQAGRCSPADRELARVNRLTAEMELLKAMPQAKTPAK